LVNEKDINQAACPRCGEDAQWSFADAEKARVEVRCPNCGPIGISREEFDQTESDRVEIDDGA